MCETVAVLPPNLRTRESIEKQRKIGHKTRFVYFGRVICVIHELIYFMKFCYLEKMLKHFFKFYDIIIYE